MPTRKIICKHCGKIIIEGDPHNCKGLNEKRLDNNRKRREYYQKNKETLKPLMSRKWSKFRSLIIQRDNNLCQRCYIKYGIINGEELQVHHIKPRIYFPELMYDQDNVVTLCKTCNIQLGTNGIDFDWKNESYIEYKL